MLNKTFIHVVIISCASMFGVTLADSVPVVNGDQTSDQYNTVSSSDNNNFANQAQQNNQDMGDTQTNNMYAPPQNLSISQRVSRLEAQVNNQQSMSMPNQIQGLQQQIEKMQGQLQVQAHELKLMQDAMIARKLLKSQSTSQTYNQPAESMQSDDDPVSSNTTIPTPISPSTAAPAASSNTTNSFLGDENTYQTASNLIAASKYPEAITAMQNYLKKYPEGKYAANANYWLGELYLLENNNAAATKSFQTVISNYPRSDKLPDAILKLGLIEYDSGQLSLAKAQLEKVVKNYPNTTVARLASARLLDIDKRIQEQQNNDSQKTSPQTNTTQ